ncbi:uncharacterized protein CC84DRAFT_1253079 [Paraphaeosphaeria sporulosa]|uniref:RING-type domain-containing protein n=1 Tax=Paraphaeosphaeria sporulosa TaxID=1460663 RepID=A0A177C3Z5_9PLEO|nr:uncharacterized protein CC84DRAFT_1253079 [Paraphaeosphaeria sporulosa]OAG02353.1 hypothetical protein CC84DRAFT_1253079 [Paraphaeosphaeria sporulosa]
MDTANNMTIMPFKLQRWTQPIPADDRTCYVCLREFGAADEADDPACEALRPKCGHYVGSTCFLKLVQTGSPMVCFCQTPYPRAEPTFVRKLAVLLLWRLFLVELWVFEPIKRYFDGPSPARAARIEHFSSQLARGEQVFDIEMAGEVFSIGGRVPLAIVLMFNMPFCLFFRILTFVLEGLPLSTYAKAWIPRGLFGYQVANAACFRDLVFSLFIALVAAKMYEDIGMAEDNQDLPVGHVQVMLHRLLTSLQVLIYPVHIVFFSRTVYLALQISDYRLILMYCVSLLLAFHVGLYKVLSSRSFYKPSMSAGIYVVVQIRRTRKGIRNIVFARKLGTAIPRDWKNQLAYPNCSFSTVKPGSSDFLYCLLPYYNLP